MLIDTVIVIVRCIMWETNCGTLIIFVWAGVDVVSCLNDRTSYFSRKSSIFWSWTAKEAVSMKDVHIYANRLLLNVHVRRFFSCLISNVLSVSPARCIWILNASHVEFGSALCFIHTDCTTYSANWSFSLRMKSKWVRKKTKPKRTWSLDLRFISIVTFQGWTSLCNSVVTWPLIFAIAYTSDFWFTHTQSTFLHYLSLTATS